MANILGIEINKEAMIVAFINSKGKKNTVTKCEYISLTDEDFSKKDNFVKKLMSVVGKIAKKTKLKKTKCVVSMPPELGTYKNITVPFRGAKKIDQIILNEIEPKMLSSVDMSVAAFHTINFATDEKKESAISTDIFVATYEVEVINLVESVLASFKLKINKITIGGSYLIARTMMKEDEFSNQDGLFIDMRKKSATLCFVHKNQIVSMQSVNLSFKRSAMDDIALSVKRTLYFLNDIFAVNLHPKFIVLSGIIKKEQALKNSLKKQIAYIPQFKPAIQNTFFEISSDVAWLENKMYGLRFLFGSKIFGKNNIIDFASKPMSIVEHIKDNKKSVVRAATVFILALTIFMSGFLYDIKKVNNELKRVDNEIIKIFKINFPKEKNIIKPVHQMRENLKNIEKDNSLLAKATDSNIFITDILSELSATIPLQVDIGIKKMSIINRDIMIEGDTNSFNTIDIIQKRLITKSIFKNVKIGSANIDKKTKRTNFRLTIYTE